MTLSPRFVRGAGLGLVLLACASVHAQGLNPPPAPPANPVTVSKSQLGKVLFWEEQLSSTGTTACGTCHLPSAGGSDPRSAGPDATHPGFDDLFGTADDVQGSPGVSRTLVSGEYEPSTDFGLGPQVTGRRGMSVINAAYFQSLFWDGRADSSFEDPITGATLIPVGGALESQAVEPPLSDVEMAHVGQDWPALAAKIATATPLDYAATVPGALDAWIAGRSYPDLFNEAFGTPDVTPARIAMAIATYERTQFSDQTPFNAAISGNPMALTPQENMGRQVFNGPGRCVICHSGPFLSDGQFHYTGVRPNFEDLGRRAVTGNIQDTGRMRTPTLLNVELRAPFFHDGSAATLEEVVDFYIRGGDFNAPNKAPQIGPINISPPERNALLAFLRRPMTDLRVRDELAPFDRPTLYSESSHVPGTFGSGTTGTGGLMPRMIALEPPASGNASFSVAVDHVTGGLPAVFAIDSQSNPFGSTVFGTQVFIGLSSALSLHRIPATQGQGVGQGYASVEIPIPPDAGLVGASLFGQWFVLDPGAPGRFAATDAVAFTIY